MDEAELRRPGPSYTIDTIEEFRRREPDTDIFYLVGQDNVPSLSNWHRFEELQKLVKFVVLDRTGEETNHPYLIVQRKIDISATEIRKRVASNGSIRYLVPEAVEEIIRREGLYQEK
jgi:nicotinate-nucleotide adenylyltransferase